MISTLPRSLIEEAKKVLSGTHYKTYYRGTNNKKEEHLIASGNLRNSTNHVTGEKENGLSVSDTPSVGKYFSYMYELTGKEIGTGSDGEPLLDTNTIKFIRWVNESSTLTESTNIVQLPQTNDVKTMNKFIKDKSDVYVQNHVKLYHGTHPNHPIMEQGLLHQHLQQEDYRCNQEVVMYIWLQPLKWRNNLVILVMG
jgi:hypothetical protein